MLLPDCPELVYFSPNPERLDHDRMIAQQRSVALQKLRKRSGAHQLTAPAT